MNSDDVEALRAEIYRLEAEGHGLSEIARLAGCDPRTVYRNLKSRVGRDGRRAAGRGLLADPTVLTDAAVVAAIGAHVRAGLSTGQIVDRIERDFGAEAISRANIGRLAAAHRRAAGNGYRGPSAADIKAAAAADPDSLRAEVEILRSHAYALNRLISRTTGNDRARIGLLRELRELIDCIARAYRAAHAGHGTRDDSLESLLGDAAEERLNEGMSNGTSDHPPAPDPGA
ncbi:MAG TPA: helix-turn-helix domain-containing protein [Chloroflexota bacterium]|jgi:AcrR family transcriptional regulator